jgi:hypothetical protein
MRKVIVFTFFLTLILFSAFAFTEEKLPKEHPKHIVYVPLDERPLNLGYVEEVAQASSVPLVTPPKDLLPDYKTPASVDALWSWLFNQKAAVAVLSADALVYGGLISSRIHEIPSEDLASRVERFREYRKVRPNQIIFVFVTLMRTPDANSAAEEPDYYAMYGKTIFRFSALEDKKSTVGLTSEEEKELRLLKERVPGEVYNDWVNRRQKNLVITKKLIEMAKEGVINYLVLCRDDTSRFSRSRQEYRELQEITESLSAYRFISFPGTDEVGLVLAARAALELEGKHPKVYVSYAPGAGPETVPGYEDVLVGENVSAHLGALYCEETKEPGEADLVLILNTPRNGITGEATYQGGNKDPKKVASVVSEVEKFSSEGIPVALADIAYSNGADNALIESLVRKGLLFNLRSYAGMNTAGNAIGYALGQGLLLGKAEETEVKRVLVTRLLDDWGYQANVRQIIRSQNLTEEEAKAEVRQELTILAQSLDAGAVSVSVDTFWNQVFNVGIRVQGN